MEIVFPPGSPAYTLFGTGFWECSPWSTLTKLTGRYQQGRNVVGVGVDLIIVVIGVINDDSSCLSSPLSFVKSKGDCDGCWRGQSWRNLHHWGSLDKNSCWLMLGNSYHRKNSHLFEFGIFKDLNSKRPGLADTVRRFFTVYKVFLFLFFFFTIFFATIGLERCLLEKERIGLHTMGSLKTINLPWMSSGSHFNLSGLVSFQTCAGVFYPGTLSRCCQVPAHRVERDDA